MSGYLVSAFAGQFFWASICDQLRATKKVFLLGVSLTIATQLLLYFTRSALLFGLLYICLGFTLQPVSYTHLLREAMTNYSLDGIFFNIPGYPTTDYDGNYVGICQCENCKRRFYEWSGGMTLPTVEDDRDPAYRKYEEFKVYTVADMLHRVRLSLIHIFRQDGKG